MRYLVTFLRVCGVVLIAFIGCGDSGEEEGCESYELPPSCLFGDCPDPCEGVVCPPDDDVCTEEYCSGGGCISRPVENGAACTYDGLSGVCVEGVCGQNLCEDDVCEDDDACTEGTCDYADGTCDFAPVVCDDHEECTEDTCDPADGCVFTAVEDGTGCGSQGRVCVAGECVFAVCNQGLCEADAERKAQCEELMPACLTDCENACLDDCGRCEDECIGLALILICNAE